MCYYWLLWVSCVIVCGAYRLFLVIVFLFVIGGKYWLWFVSVVVLVNVGYCLLLFVMRGYCFQCLLALAIVG